MASDSIRLPARSRTLGRAAEALTTGGALAALALIFFDGTSRIAGIIVAAIVGVGSATAVARRAIFLDAEGVRVRGVTSSRRHPWNAVRVARLIPLADAVSVDLVVRDQLGNLTSRGRTISPTAAVDVIKRLRRHGVEVDWQSPDSSAPYLVRRLAHGVETSAGLAGDSSPPERPRRTKRELLLLGSVAVIAIAVSVAVPIVINRYFRDDSPVERPTLPEWLTGSETIAEARDTAETAWLSLDEPNGEIDCAGAIPVGRGFGRPTFVRVVGAEQTWEVAAKFEPEGIELPSQWRLVDLSGNPSVYSVGDPTSVGAVREVWANSSRRGAWFVCA